MVVELPPKLSEQPCVARCPPLLHVYVHEYNQRFFGSCLFLLRVSLLLAGVREELTCGHRQQGVKSEAHALLS